MQMKNIYRGIENDDDKSVNFGGKRNPGKNILFIA